MNYRLMASALLALVMLTVALPAAGQDESANDAVALAAQSRPAVQAVLIEADERIELDGILDEPIWRRAAPATDFRQRDPNNGAPATERTEVRIVFDRNRIVLGVMCFDSEPHRLLGNQMQRDQPFGADDRFMWAIDPYLDGRTGYFFEINPSGAMGDGLITGLGGGGGGGRGPGGGGFGGFGGQMNKSWDGIWTARVRKTDQGWSAEIEIPFRTLNFDPKAAAWGANFQRTVRRKNEESLWTGWLRNEGLTRMSNAGRIVGLRDLTQGIGLDIKPYAVATLGNSPGSGAPNTVGTGDVGVDFFYNVTPALQANFTVNTDFAETEVDQRRTNLTRFPLRFPEKREFFLSGSSYFDFPPGDAEPFFTRRIGLNAGEPQKILFGGKLLGQIGRQDVGLLHVRTGEDGGLASEDFSVARLKRRFGRASHVGMLYTRRAGVGPLAEELGLTTRQTIGADVTVATPTFLGDANLDSGAWFLHTTRAADAPGGSNAYGLRFSVNDDPWGYSVNFREVQESYDAAIGFTPRRNFRRWNGRVNWSPRTTSHPLVRGFDFSVNPELVTDLQNRLITRQFFITPLQVEFHSGDRVEFQVFPTREHLETDFEISDGILLPLGNRYSWTRYQVSFNGASRRMVSGRAEYSDGGFWSGERRETTLSVNVRPRPGVFVQLEAEFNDVDLPEGSFETTLYSLDARTQFSPWISLANNIQYDSVSRIVGWQLRFRWILKPGDDIFFVYSHNWLDDLDLNQFRVLDRRAAMKVLRTWRF
ncbi:MAG: DUF5916 domain-containing protein [Acidobacteriota bacterium]